MNVQTPRVRVSYPTDLDCCISQLCNSFSQDQVLRMNGATEHFMCPVDANTYGLEFTKFILRDMKNNQELLRVMKPGSCPRDQLCPSIGLLKYELPASILRLDTIGTTIEFAFGEKEASELYMIERHYFRDILLKTFRFNFGYVMPRSRNALEHIYELPKLPEKLIAEIIARPYEVQSDSFYFADGKLIMHNRAEYAYFDKKTDKVDE